MSSKSAEREKTPKSLSWLLAILWLALLFTACVPKGPTLKVKIATDATYPPFETIDLNTKAMSGFDIDLMQAIASRTGLEVEYINTRYDLLLPGVARCQYDAAISAIPIADDAQQTFKFSDPYLSAGQVVVVKKGNLTITGQEKLSGMMVGSQRGTSGAAAAARIPGIQLQEYNRFDGAFNDLIRGMLDAVVIDGPLAKSYVEIPANNLKVIGDEFAIQNYAIAICGQRGDLLERVNRGIKSLQSDRSLQKLETKWFTTSN